MQGRRLNPTTSDLTVSEVRDHLLEMKQIYDTTVSMNVLQLYEYLRLQEQYYMQDRTLNCFAHTVHKLHPAIYADDCERLRGQAFSFKWTLDDRLSCPVCKMVYPMDQAFAAHIYNGSANCPCGAGRSYAELAIGTLVERWNANSCLIVNRDVGEALPLFLNDGDTPNWNEFSFMIQEVTGRSLWPAEKSELRRVIHQHYDNLSSLGLDLIKAMYRHLDFVAKICVSFDYWNQQHVLEECVQRYSQFMTLVSQQRDKAFVPTVDIALAMQAHQSHHDRYRIFADTFIGRLVEPDDCAPGVQLSKGYARTCIKWSQAYGEPYSHEGPRWVDYQTGRWARSLMLPLGVYRAVVYWGHSAAKARPEVSRFAVVGTPVTDVSKRVQLGRDDALHTALKVMDHPKPVLFHYSTPTNVEMLRTVQYASRQSGFGVGVDVNGSAGGATVGTATSVGSYW